MTEQQQLVQNVVDGIVAGDQREANRAANLANAVTAIYGISGSGKSSLGDTAAEYAWEAFGKITLCYVADLGGFGNKRLSLIRAGIMRVWDPRNHQDAFATMELMSLGAWPERLVDAETGYAAPDVRLVLPRRMTYTMICPQGHEVKRSDDQRVFAAATFPCPTCGMQTNMSNALRVERQIVRHKMFANVGLRIYDSMTALNAWGMDDLQRQSAAGTLPTSSSGGSALAGADALYSGQFKFSTGSKPQYGFLQNRTYGWLSNIKTIPDQIVPAIATFLVESSSGGDDTGGEPVYGLKIAGSAKTAEAASWVGNLLHATKEPNNDGVMVHRLWLTNHIDPRDPRRIPYLAKHRGTPLGMPDVLEDVPGEPAWSRCSMKIFFTLLNEQLLKMEAEQAARYPNTPGMWTEESGDDVDEVVGTVAATAARGVSMAAGAGASASASVAGAPVVQGAAPQARRIRRPAAGAPSPNAAAVVGAPPVQSSAAPVQVGTAAGPAPTVVTEDGASTPAVASASDAVPTEPVKVAGAPPIDTPASSVPVATAVPAASTAPAKQTVTQPVTQPVTQAAPAATASPLPPQAAPPAAGAPTGARPLRRIARPPV